jgi:hypothetical protein
MTAAFIAHWFWFITGARNEATAAYGLWSGVGGALPDVCLLTAVAAWYWHRTCHVSRCWRPGRHAVEGTPYRACRRHHPGGLPRRITAEHLADARRGEGP